MNTGSHDDFSDDAVQIQLTVLVLALTDEAVTDLGQSLSRIQSLQYKIQQSESSTPLRDLLGESSPEVPDVIILELDGHHEEALDDIRRFVEEYGQQTEVFATFARSKLDIMPSLMRSGVRDVLPLPLNHQDLVVALVNSESFRTR